LAKRQGWRVGFAFILFAATAIASSAQTFTTLVSFDGTDGSGPYSGLVQGTDGNFHATTFYGGARNHGTVFKITPAGTLTTLHNIDPNGAGPNGLIQATDGNFYGTTRGAGTAQLAPPTFPAGRSSKSLQPVR
jgi:uncharacterized repeat protein (TIGR03803 family)